jgi:hypothetical protein
MSAILRWFNDGDVRYRAYFRASEAGPSVRQLIIATRDGEAVDVVDADVKLEDYSHDELLACARRLRLQMQARAELSAIDTAAD